MPKPKSRITLQRKYKKGAVMLAQNDLPTMPILSAGFVVHSAEITADGYIEIVGGEEYEFIDMRVLIKKATQ